MLANHPLLEVVAPDPFARPSLPRVRLRAGATGDELVFERLGYADAALASFETFSGLQRDGVIPAGCRFQVSLPPPATVTTVFVVPEDRAAVGPAYEAALLGELDAIAAAIPHDRLAIQWDVVIGGWERAVATDDERLRRAVLDPLARYGARVPADVELGYHLCFGDYQGRHPTERADAAGAATLASALAAVVGRPIQWIHLPVPRGRADDAYFAPLRELRLGPETELYLGLVHLAEGVEGTRRHVAAAQRAVPRFGVATECGLGRQPPERIPELLRLHAEVASPLA